MTEDTGAIRGPEARGQRSLAEDIKESVARHGDSWIYRFSPPDTISVSGNINNFDLAKYS